MWYILLWAESILLTRYSEFGLAFLDAKERCNARTRHGSFDTSVIEIDKDDLKTFLGTMCEGHR